MTPRHLDIRNDVPWDSAFGWLVAGYAARVGGFGHRAFVLASLAADPRRPT
jgi:hypothetical protein